MEISQQLFANWWETLTIGVVAASLIWLLLRNEDFMEHRWRLVFGALLMIAGFAFGFAFIGQYGATNLVKCAVGLEFAIMASPFFVRVMDRAINDLIGGFIFDMIFAEGPFAERFRNTKELPNLSLLRHWHDHGMKGKAFRVARGALIHEPRAFGHWLFAAETAALHLNRFSTAKTLVRRLCNSKAFPEYQKEYAVNVLAAWAAQLGQRVDIGRLMTKVAVNKARLSAVSEASRLRTSGRPSAAVARLRAALRQNPDDLAAALQLILVLTEDFQDFSEAEEVISGIANRPYAPTAFVDFARATINGNRSGAAVARSITESSTGKFVLVPSKFGLTKQDDKAGSGSIEQLKSPRMDGPEMPPSIDPKINSLMEAHFIGTAVEQLERNLEKYPEDYNGWMRLADIYINECFQQKPAERIVQRIINSRDFTAEQKAAAVANLRKWKIEYYHQQGW